MTLSSCFSYGFKHVYIPQDILHWWHAVWPFQHLTDHELSFVKKGVDFSQVKFATVLVFHDSRDWGKHAWIATRSHFTDLCIAGRDIQLVTDLVRSVDGVFGTHKSVNDPKQWLPEAQIPLHFSNPGQCADSLSSDRELTWRLADLLWGNEFPQSRYGQGAFQESMAAVYKAVTGHELQRSACPYAARLTPKLTS